MIVFAEKMLIFHLFSFDFPVGDIYLGQTVSNRVHSHHTCCAESLFFCVGYSRCIKSVGDLFLSNCVDIVVYSVYFVVCRLNIRNMLNTEVFMQIVFNTCVFYGFSVFFSERVVFYRHIVMYGIMQFFERTVESSFHKRGCDIINKCCISTSFGYYCLSDIVYYIEIRVGKISDEYIRPVSPGKSGLPEGRELKRAMCAEVHNSISFKTFSYIKIFSNIWMRWGHLCSMYQSGGIIPDSRHELWYEDNITEFYSGYCYI